jgi:hypothetical protein
MAPEVAGHRPEAATPLSSLYEVDETAWLETMAGLIAERRFEELDYENLAEFLSSMAIRDRREVLSRLTVLLAHLLKWEYEPKKRTRSWISTIVTQRDDLESILESATLLNHARDVLPKAYKKAVRRASAETSLAESVFPATCPGTLEEVLTKPLSTD